VSFLKIKTYPDPCLRIRTGPVEQFTQDISKTLRSMADIMYVGQGIGLAATQVGLGLSVLVVDIGDGLTNYINPAILERSRKKSSMEEGCLSLPGIIVNVARPEEITVRAQDEQGEFFIRKLSGLAAKTVQHEIDHIHGRLIIDYLDPIRRFMAARKLAGLKRRQTGKTCEASGQ